MPLDIQQFREENGGDLAVLRKSQAARHQPVEAIDEVVEADKLWVKAEFAVNQAKKNKNAASKQIGLIMRNKELSKEEKTQQAAAMRAKSKEMDEEVKQAEERRAKLAVELETKLRAIGNLVHPGVPVAKTENDNRVERTWGVPFQTGKERHHHELLHMIGGFEAERGVQVAGHRAYFLRGVGVMLNQALINYGLAFLHKEGYTPLQPPYFMKKDVMAKTAQLSEFDEALYKLVGENEEYYMIATSEQPISALHMGDWLEGEQLPIAYAGLSTCFRKEAGSHGKDAWGIFRVHQFEKVEQFVVCKPEDSWKWHKKMLQTAERFYQSLKIPYRVINIVSGELNNAAARKFDVEAWFPTLGVFRELVSSSNCTDYQSRAMETRYGFKPMKGSPAAQTKQYVHMLNATLTATERTICCLLENYQDEKGVHVPEVLQPFMGGIKFMPFVNDPPKAVAGQSSTKKKGKGKGKNKNKGKGKGKN